MPTFVPGDRDALIRAIETLNDDALVDALGAKGLSLFSEEFGPESGLRNLEAAYERATRRPFQAD